MLALPAGRGKPVTYLVAWYGQSITKQLVVVGLALGGVVDRHLQLQIDPGQPGGAVEALALRRFRRSLEQAAVDPPTDERDLIVAQ